MKCTQLDLAYEHVNALSFLGSFGEGISHTLLTMETPPPTMSSHWDLRNV
jgi:hypothetical protein